MKRVKKIKYLFLALFFVGCTQTTIDQNKVDEIYNICDEHEGYFNFVITDTGLRTLSYVQCKDGTKHDIDI